ncbi:MAG: WYL domain-containing protein [Anaeromyxobacter sp.]
MFTRDKADLERLGFVLDREETGQALDPYAYAIDARASALPLLSLTPEEGALVWTAGAAALRLSDHPLRDELESALRKLSAGGGPALARAAALEEAPLEPGEGAPAGDAALKKLVDAWERRRRIRFDYLRVGTGERLERAVDVYGWARRRGEWIFVGHCHLRDAVRIFYLSRASRLRVSPREGYRIPEDFDIRRWARQQAWDYQDHPPLEAQVRFRGALARIARTLLPGARLSAEPDGARLARLEVRNLRGLVRQALAWGPNAELVAPAEGRALAREILAGLAAALDGRAP